MLHRELDLALGEVATVLDAEGFDRLAAKAERYATLLQSLDDTLAALEESSWTTRTSTRASNPRQRRSRG